MIEQYRKLWIEVGKLGGAPESIQQVARYVVERVRCFCPGSVAIIYDCHDHGGARR